MTKIEELEVELKGRVQGVNFRWMTKRFADKLGLKGYVMNKEDGSVFLTVQGKREDINKIILWVQKNPGFSKVWGLSYNWKKPTIDYNEFTIVKDKSFVVDKAKSMVNLGRFFAGKYIEKIPIHVAIIPDGNRRWAKEKGLFSSLGHYKAGNYDNLELLFKEAKDMGVMYMSLWGFSTENWKRDKKEISAIFNLILKGVDKFRRDGEKNKIRFRHIGRKDRIPERLRIELAKLEKETAKYDKFNVQLCLDYGGRDEIIRAVNKMIRSGVKKIDEKIFADYLDTKGIPDPDLVIRTSREYRTSGLMPYQARYAELYFSNVYFPDFDAKELRKAINEYSKRQRRFGGS